MRGRGHECFHCGQWIPEGVERDCSTTTEAALTRIEPSSTRKFAHFVHVIHRDGVEPPLTDWIREAYDVSLELSGPAKTAKPRKRVKKR